MDKKKKELILFYVLLAIIGGILGASVASRLGSITLPLQVLEALFCGSLVGPITIVASNLVFAGRPKKCTKKCYLNLIIPTVEQFCFF